MTRIHPHRPSPDRRSPGRGFTIIEALVVLAALVAIIAVVLPALATVGCSSFRATSRQNLAALGAANDAYAVDWANRQFTMVPDNLGVYGSCANYLGSGNCITGAQFGTTCKGVEVGFLIGCGAAGDCSNFPAVSPIGLSTGNAFGAYRIPNAAGMQPYVDGRFYSPTFYAPDDSAIIGDVEPLLSIDCGYAGGSDLPIYSSYAYSPAAMFGLGVLKRQTGYKNPNFLAEGYTSPPVTAATYPSLKTRMIEFRAIEPQCPPGEGPCNEYQFNQIYEARPLALMFDGSVSIVSPRKAMESDTRVKVSTQGAMVEKGLWIRNTPFGVTGVGGSSSFDFLVRTSYHFLTGDGIAGRDVIDW